MQLTWKEIIYKTQEYQKKRLYIRVCFKVCNENVVAKIIRANS